MNKKLSTVFATSLALAVLLSPLSCLAAKDQSLADNPVVELEVRKRIQASGSSPEIILEKKVFEGKMENAKTIKFEYSDNAINTVYIFFDPLCPGCKGLKDQLSGQFELYQDNEVNVEIIPIAPNNNERSFKEAVHIFADSVDYESSTIGQVKAYIADNTHLYESSFSTMGTPLVLWPTNDGYEVLKGYPKKSTNEAFLKIVSEKKGVYEWLMSYPKGQ